MAKKDAFYLGVAEDGTFVAASVDAVVFCFVADSEQEAVAKACRAYIFAQSPEPRRQVVAKSRTSTVIDFLPAKRVPICEAPLAAAVG